MPQIFQTRQGHRLAYHQSPGQAPFGIVFLGGLTSDMEGTKATHLEKWAQEQGYGFLRFDYSGHGESDGEFEEGTIGLWAQDALEIVTALTSGPQILVGSSMGGWIALLISQTLKDRVAAIIGIAAAPDFTENYFWDNFTEEERGELTERGVIYVPSDYEEPYAVTKHLIEDGREHLIFPREYKLDCPIHLLYGAADNVVSLETQLRLIDHLETKDMMLTVVKEGDHSLSRPADLQLLESVIQSTGAKISQDMAI